MAVACKRFLTPFFFVFLGSCVTPPVRGSNILGARHRRVPSKSLIRRLNLLWRFSHTCISSDDGLDDFGLDLLHLFFQPDIGLLIPVHPQDGAA